MISHSESLKLLEYGNSREGNKEAIVDLLTDYLQADLEVKERVWSWWHLVDNLAILRRCGDAVTQQENYLKWAISSNLASQFILEVMNDGTQASCWLQLNRLDDWINIFNQLIDNTKPSQENRLARFYYFRTAARIFSTATRYELAENSISQLKNLILEDINWENKTWVEIEIAAVELNLLEAKDDIDRACQVAGKVKEQIESIEKLQLANPIKISTLWHNNAAPLFRMGLYSEAELMFRRAIASNPQNWCSLVFLAACLTKIGKYPEESDKLLAKAASLTNQRDYEALLFHVFT
jgi:tetratricopeptide (TPR) repeat protein